MPLACRAVVERRRASWTAAAVTPLFPARHFPAGQGQSRPVKGVLKNIFFSGGCLRAFAPLRKVGFRKPLVGYGRLLKPIEGPPRGGVFPEFAMDFSYKPKQNHRPERLKKCCSRSAARNFGVLARLSEGACPQRPVTERKRSQNPKEPLPPFPHPNGYSIFENALVRQNPKEDQWVVDGVATEFVRGNRPIQMPLTPYFHSNPWMFGGPAPPPRAARRSAGVICSTHGS